MATKALVEKISSSVSGRPERAEVLRLRQHSTDELERRAKRLLATVGEAFGLPVGRADWVVGPTQTLIRMPGRSRALYHHASGAMKVAAGLEPMEALFGHAEHQAELVQMVEHAAARLNLRDFIGRDEAVRFERLWSIKAAAANREGSQVPPVLCRVVGAYRHFVGEVPVWGPASIALTLAGGGRFDSLALNMRETAGETIARPSLLAPEQAAQNIALRLETLMGQSRIDLDEAARLDWARFGYLSLPARKAQTVLAPVFIAAISIIHERVRQAYVLVAPATENHYLSLPLYGDEAATVHSRNGGVVPPIRRIKTFDKPAAFGQVS